MAKFLPQAFILYVSSNSVAQLLIESWILPESNANVTPPSSLNHQGTCKPQTLVEAKVTLFPYAEALPKRPWHRLISLDNTMHRQFRISH